MGKRLLLTNVKQNVNIASAYFWVYNHTTLLSCPYYASPGDKITVGWVGASQSPTAWIGFYKKGDPDTSPLKHIQINQGTLSGSQWVVDTSWGSGITTGNYEFRIFQDQGYTLNGKAYIAISYKTPTITVQPEQVRPGEFLTVTWTDGPDYDPYANHRLDIYQGDTQYRDLQIGLGDEGTVKPRIRQDMPPGMYQVRMTNGEDGSVMGSTYFAVVAADAANTTGTTGTTGASSSPQLTAAASGQSIVLNWTAPSNTSGLTGYYIYRGASPGGESASPLRDFPVTQTTYTDIPTGSGTYYYIVKPVYNSATPGSPSNEASATVGSAGGVTIALYVG